MTLLQVNTPAKKVAYFAMLLSVALMISYLESLLPPLIPGMKPGLANIAVMAAMCVSVWGAVGVSTARVLICAVLFGNTVSFMMSVSGALVSLCVLILIRSFKVKNFSWIGVSILSALGHNLGQLICAAVLSGSSAAFLYAPILLVASLVCGALCGFIMNMISVSVGKRKTENNT